MSHILSHRNLRQALSALALLLAAAALLLYPQASMEAAREGLALCYNVIIPSLFPFFVLSSLVVELGLAAYLGRALEGIMRPLFRVNGACASAFVLGFLGGYPVGAKTAIGLYQNGMCSRTEAERLLSFCNNSGPAFILGVVGAGIFASSRAGVLLYLAHAAASVCVGLVFRFYGERRERGGSGSGPRPSFQAKRFTAAFTATVKNAFFSTLSICAFVVFFTVVIRLLFLSGALPALAGLLARIFAPLGFTRPWAERLLTGVIELSSGVWSLSSVGGEPLAGRLAMAAFMLGWAGLSVHCQVLSFIGDSGLSTRTYLLGKLLHGALSAVFTALLVRAVPLDAPVSAILAQQVDGIAAIDFSSALALSAASAWLIFLVFLWGSAACLRKKGGASRRHVV